MQEVRGFIGAIEYYRFIPGFSRIVIFLINLMKKYAQFKWLTVPIFL